MGGLCCRLQPVFPFTSIAKCNIPKTELHEYEIVGCLFNLPTCGIGIQRKVGGFIPNLTHGGWTCDQCHSSHQQKDRHYKNKTIQNRELKRLQYSYLLPSLVDD
jgi:hypothetical protein